MKTTITTLATSLTIARSAFAATGAHAEGLGLLTWLFLGFVTMIIVLQCAPAAVLLTSMVRSMFEGTAAKDVAQPH